MPANPRIGDLLVSSNIITEDQLKDILNKQEKLGKKIGDLLIESGIIDEKTFLSKLALQLKVQFTDLAHFSLNPNLARKLSETIARRCQAIVLEEKNGAYVIGMVDPLDVFSFDEVYRELGKPITTTLVSQKELVNALNSIYRRTGEITNFADKLGTQLKPQTPVKDDESFELEQAKPIVSKLINSLFEDAVQVNASDIHIEPGESILRIRLRVDGFLQEQIVQLTEKYIAPALNQRLKLMCGLNIAEKRLPQDGRFNIKINDNEIDVRLSTMPTQYGESIVMRLLRKSAKIILLDETGMPPDLVKRIRNYIRLPHGIILVTGPTGSGKTTTLYGALSEINEPTKNIITIEDPIEYRLERANQVQVNSQLGLTFARVLRAALRQDPNVILVGEIRDQETAQIALRAALTGHLVFATLHTNDAASTALRMIDIGAEGYLVAATTRLILAQRLLRKICNNCKKPYTPTETEQAFFTNFFPNKFPNDKFYYGAGCNTCNNTGYRGRQGVFEILELDREMRDALRRNNSTDFTRTVEKNRKTPSLMQNAFEIAEQGITTLEEVMRVTGEEF
jgi:MSHA biogenesis protein MshE